MNHVIKFVTYDYVYHSLLISPTTTIYLTGFWIYHGFKKCQGSEHISVQNISGFIKKTLHHVDAWQSTDYSSGSAYTRVLYMPGLHKAL